MDIKKRGGARPGAGKPKGKYGKYAGEHTILVRVPESLKALVMEFLLAAMKIRPTEQWNNWLDSWHIETD